MLSNLRTRSDNVRGIIRNRNEDDDVIIDVEAVSDDDALAGVNVRVVGSEALEEQVRQHVAKEQERMLRVTSQKRFLEGEDDAAAQAFGEEAVLEEPLAKKHKHKHALVEQQQHQQQQQQHEDSYSINERDLPGTEPIQVRDPSRKPGEKTTLTMATRKGGMRLDAMRSEQAAAALASDSRKQAMPGFFIPAKPKSSSAGARNVRVGRGAAAGGGTFAALLSSSSSSSSSAEDRAISMGSMTPFEAARAHRREVARKQRDAEAKLSANHEAAVAAKITVDEGSDGEASGGKARQVVGTGRDQTPTASLSRKMRGAGSSSASSSSRPSRTLRRTKLKEMWKDDGDIDAFEERRTRWREEMIQQQVSSGLDEEAVRNLSDVQLASGRLLEPCSCLFPGEGVSAKKKQYVLPKHTYKDLFPYQKTGVRWMCELHEQRVGGIIGDEMGLGKTIQIACLLATMHLAGRLRRGVLIVVPATVMQQWVMELHQWWPALRVCLLHESGSIDVNISSAFAETTNSGRAAYRHVDAQSREDRRKVCAMLEALCGDDKHEPESPGVLITTYSGVRLQLDLLLRYRWQYIILDEGHKIRNPDAAATVAVKQFQTPHRLILTGSPIQNSLRELWSLVDFCFPGKLGTLATFESEFATPITHGGLANATEAQALAAYKCAVALRDLINPYLLRRLKKDVLADVLPEQKERVLFCTLSQRQRDLYSKFLRSEEVESILAGNRNLLSGIDVLRKICNHPDLLFLEKKSSEDKRVSSILRGEDYPFPFGDPERSGKLQLLTKLLTAWCVSEPDIVYDTATSRTEPATGLSVLPRPQKELHKVLLFCQTRQMLEVVEALVRDNLRIPYRRMDGETPISLRMAMVEEFNDTDVRDLPLFLLSTRVGGLGLNLTSADRVLIVDPDWNPATDHQARERACRIGQTRSVSIFRLITSGTIEEKIYHRQIFKQMLTNKVLNDPNQNRFFKAGDLKDLFSLGSEYLDDVDTREHLGWVRPGERGTTDGDDSIAMTKLRQRQTKTEEIFGHRVSDHHSPSSAPSEDNEHPETKLLRDLFDEGDGVRVVSHDRILGVATSGLDPRNASQKYADSVAAAAVRALRQSRQEIAAAMDSFSVVPSPFASLQSASSASSTASVVRPRFGRSASLAAGILARSAPSSQNPLQPQPTLRSHMPQQQQQQAARTPNEFEGFFGAHVAGLGTSSAKTDSRTVLSLIRERAQAETARISPAERESAILVERLRSFLIAHGAVATTDAIVSRFGAESSDPRLATLLRSLLKRIALFSKTRHVWELRPKFQEHDVEQ